MTEPTVFAFPTAEGYRFLPGLGRDTGEVLSRLTPQSAGATLTSFVKVAWMGRYRLLRRRALLMTGIVSSGIQGEVHRGAYSIWTALKIVSCTYSPGSPLLGREEAAIHLADLFDDFQGEISQARLCQPFHDAFMTSVQVHVDPAAVQTVLANIKHEITDPSVFKNASFLSPAR